MKWKNILIKINRRNRQNEEFIIGAIYIMPYSHTTYLHNHHLVEWRQLIKIDYDYYLVVNIFPPQIDKKRIVERMCVNKPHI